jgi:acyl-coenzyme A synthetase/AMP-(fatty) acid ligase
VIAVTIDPSQASTPDIEIEVIHRAEAALGKAMKPYAVVVVPELPLTRSGKIHRRALRSWLANSDPGDVSSVESLGCEDAIRTAGQSIDGLEGCGLPPV